MPGTNLFATVTNTLKACLTDQNGLIVIGSCVGTPPTTPNTFAKGAMIIQTDLGTNNNFQNTGTTASPVWSLNQAGLIPSAQLSPDTVQTASVALSSAQILALNATPVTIIPAQGAGTVIVVTNVLFKMVTTATAYASGGVVTFQYAGGNAVTNNIAATVVTAGAGTSYTVRDGIDVTAAANTGITVTNATGAFTTGTGTAVISISYRVATI